MGDLEDASLKRQRFPPLTCAMNPQKPNQITKQKYDTPSLNRRRIPIPRMGGNMDCHYPHRIFLRMPWKLMKPFLLKTTIRNRVREQADESPLWIEIVGALGIVMIIGCLLYGCQ